MGENDAPHAAPPIGDSRKMDSSSGEDVSQQSGDTYSNSSNKYFCELCRSIPSPVLTKTVEDQQATEKKVALIFNQFMELNPTIDLFIDFTVDFLRRGLLKQLSSSYSSLDASRPWLCYWILHSLQMLGHECTEEECSHVVQFLNKCKDEKRGGYGGGPGQVAHAAPTYAAVNALCTIGTKEALMSIDRQSLAKFFESLHQADGSYIMHEDGEVDIRGVYCCASVAKLINLPIDSSSMFKNSATWLSSCQSYEGGFSAVPFTEAHGGYTFCGVAGLHLLGHQDLFDKEGLLKWLVCRQMAFEGGFSGRPNKLVDSCYSFWQSSPLLIVQMLLSSSCSSTEAALRQLNLPLFNAEALTEYVLLCCQHMGGGLKDKPGANRDYYHTCYALSGLSLAHNFPYTNKELKCTLKRVKLRPVNPFFNVCQSKADNCLSFFNQMGAFTPE